MLTTWLNFYGFGIFTAKSCAKNVGVIDYRQPTATYPIRHQVLRILFHSLVKILVISLIRGCQSLITARRRSMRDFNLNQILTTIRVWISQMPSGLEKCLIGVHLIQGGLWKCRTGTNLIKSTLKVLTCTDNIITHVQAIIKAPILDNGCFIHSGSEVFISPTNFMTSMLKKLDRFTNNFFSTDFVKHPAFFALSHKTWLM